MKVTKVFLILVCLFNGLSASSDEVKPPTEVKTPAGEAEIHTLKARVHAEQKNWQGAREEAQTASQLDPASQDAWLILGTAEQRLDHNVEAITAFRKYLERNPPEEKAATVRARIAELEVSRDEQQKREDERKRKELEAERARYGWSAPGLGLGFSPIYHPKSRKEGDLRTNISRSFDVKIGIGWFALGFRYVQGNAGQLNYKETETTNKTRAKKITNTLVDNSPHTLYEFNLSSQIPLTDSYGVLAPFQLYVPIYAGMPVNSVRAGSDKYQNIGFDLASGAGLRWNTRTLFVFDLTGFYHFLSITGDMKSKSVKNTTIYSWEKVLQTPDGSKNVQGSVAGFELRLGATILLGD